MTHLLFPRDLLGDPKGWKTGAQPWPRPPVQLGATSSVSAVAAAVTARLAGRAPRMVQPACRSVMGSSSSAVSCRGLVCSVAMVQQWQQEDW